MSRLFGKVAFLWLSVLVSMVIQPVHAGDVTPTITSLIPTNGHIGHIITVAGTNLSTATAAAINGTAAVFTIVNDTYITLTVPSGASTGKVTVTTPEGVATSLTDFAVYAPTSLTVTVDPGGGYLGLLSSVALNYNLHGPQVYYGPLALDASGQTTINGLQPGSYELRLDGSHWLKRIIRDVAVNGVSGVNVTLANGDADAGNSVNLFDFVLLDTNFNGTAVMADLNGDGQVNLFDYTIVDSYFGAQGDNAEPFVSKVNPIDGAEMVWVSSGPFLMGSNESESLNQRPLRSVELAGYWIYKNEVTVAQYRQFCAATSRGMPTEPVWGWNDDYPVVYVSKADAAAYCVWAKVSLPTEAQWEKAAKGTDGREYPWGNVWDAARCSNSTYTLQTSPKPVGSYHAGMSPYGCMDMAGNVDEWCSDGWDAAYYKSAPNVDPPGAVNADYGVVRGGDWDSRTSSYARSSVRNSLSIGYDRNAYVGFRCVMKE